jgi:hypothetical protein
VSKFEGTFSAALGVSLRSLRQTAFSIQRTQRYAEGAEKTQIKDTIAGICKLASKREMIHKIQ